MNGPEERWETLRAVRLARTVLRDAFGLCMVVMGPRGPLAHVRGGVMESSNDVCRALLFSRDGFARCDAFYRETAAAESTVERVCPVGFGTISVPIIDESEGTVMGHVFSSGFIDDRHPVERADLIETMRVVDPHANGTEAVQRLPRSNQDRRSLIRAVLSAAANEIAAHESDRRRRQRPVGDVPGLWGMVGRSPQMQSVFELLPRLAASDATVLVQGESGTGKELVARALHVNGRRKSREFIAQNCAAMPDDLLESILFGHVRGAFSGAQRSSEGLFGAANGGTLFLDEVGDMSAALQVKLLRVLQDGSYLPVGSTSPRYADVRVIAATHRDIGELARVGKFRQDLYYRLHVLPVKLPPLRDRVGDLRLLVQLFLNEAENVPTAVSDAAWQCLERYGWPGNVRELRAEVQRWQITAGESPQLGPEHVSPQIREAGGYGGYAAGEAAAAAAAGRGTMADAVEALEQAIIERGLERTKGNRTRLAKELGISRTTLGERLKRYGIDD